MKLFDKPLNQVGLPDIDQLVKEQVAEDRILDYKLKMYERNDAGGRELLKDITAFANTVGGYLIIGVEEKDGYPVKIVGIDDKIDEVLRHIELVLRTGVRPAIRGIQFQDIDFNGKKILIVEVPRSLSRPHMVVKEKSNKFYARYSTINLPMEVEELRREFLSAESLAIRIRNFRNDRIGMIASGQTFLPLPDIGKIVLHLIPESSFEADKKIIITDNASRDFPTIGMHGGNCRFNFDGFINYSSSEKGSLYQYTQLFRNGIIEAVDAYFLIGRTQGEKFLPMYALEERLINILKCFIESIPKYQIEPPLWLCLSLLDAKGYTIPMDTPFTDVTFIEKNELMIPEIIINDFGIRPDLMLRPAFDAMWNACGFPESPYYDKDNNRIRRR